METHKNLKMNTDIQNTNQQVIQQADHLDMVPASVVESLVLNGDLSRMTSEQKVQYYNHICKSLGLNPLSQPFEIINLKGKLRMYAKKDATDQLRKIYGVSVTSLERTQVGDIYMITAYGQDKHGRTDSAIGALPINGLQGEALANAIMKCETKAKRRLTLSICGLGILDETEVDSIKSEEAKQSGHNTMSIDVIQPTPENIALFEPMLTAIGHQVVPDDLFLPETKQQFIDRFRSEFMSGQMPNEYANNVYNKIKSYFQ